MQAGRRRSRHDAADLINALIPRNAGRTIRATESGSTRSRTSAVPDGATLQGAGEMQFDDQGLPIGFKPGTTTTITAKYNLAGNLLTLGNRSSVRRLVLQGASQVGTWMTLAAAGTSSPSPHGARTTSSRQRSRSANSSTRSSQVAGPTGRRGARSSPTRAIPKNPHPIRRRTRMRRSLLR